MLVEELLLIVPWNIDFLQRCQVNSMEGRPPANSIEQWRIHMEKRKLQAIKKLLEMIINLNVKPKATKILDKNHGKIFTA